MKKKKPFFERALGKIGIKVREEEQEFIRMTSSWVPPRKK